MNQELLESQAIFKIIRIFIVQYLASAHSYKSIQNQSINILATHVLRILKNMIAQIKRLLLMQGRTEPNCLHQLFAIKQIGLVDLQKLRIFLSNKRSNGYKFTNVFFEKTISKNFQNDYDLANKYEKEKHYSTIRVIKNPYLFNPTEDSECYPFKSGIDEAFPKPAEFTYKNTLQKIQRENNNIESLVAFTRRENRKALGLYLDSLKDQRKPRKKVKPIEDQNQLNNNKMVSEVKKSKEFDFISFL